tara:strand:+ start:427 stop:1215 length:789 start_codon:yes stop_codon:yes gene_type:complete
MSDKKEIIAKRKAKRIAARKRANKNIENILKNTEQRITDETRKNLNNIHKKLNRKIAINFVKQELPEQEMACHFLTGDETVLEIGGNIGRNSLVIATILKDATNLLTLESSESIAKELIANREKSGLHFHIENSALSKRKLIQGTQKNNIWDTVPSDTLIKGYEWIKTITLEEIKEKYKLNFDTLVLDCEGAFYYILKDMPEIIENINLIIMENDYKTIKEYTYIRDILTANDFKLNYSRIHPNFKKSRAPCKNNFFEVWKK